MTLRELVSYLEYMADSGQASHDDKVILIHSPDDSEFHRIRPGRNHPGELWLEIDNG